MAPVPEELTARLLTAAGITVATVDIDELGPEVTAARIELGTPTGTRQVVGRLADGLALAAAAGHRSGSPARSGTDWLSRSATATFPPARAGDRRARHAPGAIYIELGVASRGEAAAIAYKLGLGEQAISK